MQLISCIDKLCWMAMISLFRVSKCKQKQTWPYYNSSRYDSWTIFPWHFPQQICTGDYYNLWRSATWRYWILLTCARQFSLWTSCLLTMIFGFACWSILDGRFSGDVERWRSDVYLVALALVCSSLESSGSLHMCVWRAIGSCIF